MIILIKYLLNTHYVPSSGPNPDNRNRGSGDVACGGSPPGGRCWYIYLHLIVSFKWCSAAWSGLWIHGAKRVFNRAGRKDWRTQENGFAEVQVQLKSQSPEDEGHVRDMMCVTARSRAVGFKDGGYAERSPVSPSFSLSIFKTFN